MNYVEYGHYFEEEVDDDGWDSELTRPPAKHAVKARDFEKGEIVMLQGGHLELEITRIMGRNVDLQYVKSGNFKSSYIHRLVKINQPTEEQPMSKYGNQSHDQIFEALIDKQFKTVQIKFPEDHAQVYHYRAPVAMELAVDDQVIVSCRKAGTESYKMARIASTDEDKSPKAVAWVVSKVDVSAHETRSAEWKTLYEGIKEAEMEKKRAILAEGYGDELAKYAPEAAKILAGFTTPQLAKDE